MGENCNKIQTLYKFFFHVYSIALFIPKSHHQDKFRLLLRKLINCSLKSQNQKEMLAHQKIICQAWW